MSRCITAPAPGASAVSKMKFLIALMMAENDYQQAQAAAAKESAAPLGIDLEISYAANDAVTQSQQLLEAIQSSGSRVSAIVCQPVGTSLERIARAAMAAGVGWGLLNREGEYIPELRKTYRTPICCVTIDQQEVGHIQGRQVAALLPEGGLILHVQGPAANPAMQIRTAGMESTLPKNIRVRSLSGKLTERSGYDAVSSWLTLSIARSEAVSLIAAHNDSMAVGARRAFGEQTSGEERDRWLGLPYIGVDACPQAGQQWIQRGLLAASVLLPPTAGLAVEILAQAISAGSQPREHTILAPISVPKLEKLSAKCR
jgi:ABC-type sugar transport system substrate-binding protein